MVNREILKRKEEKMTTITFRNIENGKSRTLLFKSIDSLKIVLNQLQKDSKNHKIYLVTKVKDGKKFIEVREEFIGCSYDQNDASIPLLQNYGLIPSPSDYPQ